MHIVAKTFEIYFLAKLSSILLVNLRQSKNEELKISTVFPLKGQYENFNGFHQCIGKFYSVFYRYVEYGRFLFDLSFKNNLLNQGKTLRRLLEYSPLKEKKVVVWHDVVNNTISSHRTNNYRPAGVEELTNSLKSKRQQILAIVYRRRKGTPDLFKQLDLFKRSLFQQQNGYSSRASKKTRSSSRNTLSCTRVLNWS